MNKNYLLRPTFKTLIINDINNISYNPNLKGGTVIKSYLDLGKISLLYSCKYDNEGNIIGKDDCVLGAGTSAEVFKINCIDKQVTTDSNSRYIPNCIRAHKHC